MGPVWIELVASVGIAIVAIAIAGLVFSRRDLVGR